MKNIILIFFTLVLSSCMATQHDMLLLQSQIDDLNSNLSTLQKNQADLALKIDNLNSSLNASNQNMADLSQDINKLSLKIDEYGTLTDKKINSIGQSVKQQQEEVSKTILPSKIYSTAVNQYTEGDIDNALKSFTEYINKYPNSNNIDNAYFYIGEIFYQKKDFQESSIFYAKILQKYPNYMKTPTVRLKYALSLLNFKKDEKKEEALNYLKSIIKDFPSHQEAKQAKEILNKEIKPKKPSTKINKTKK